MKEYQSFATKGALPHRSYYLPFAENDRVKYRYGIVDRRSSSEFISLDGEWQIKAHSRPEEVDVNEELFDVIPVPASVQMHGYDQLQYLNCRYPFPCIPPYVPHENPTWHYRKNFRLSKQERAYYLHFEGVDSFFYVYVNGELVGYSQVSHATSEFDVTDLVKEGENVLDVVVLKWCASSYLECQDKFRFSGIFRSVYLLDRPKKHIEDYRIQTHFDENGKGILTFANESDIPVLVRFENKTACVNAWGRVAFTKEKPVKWTAENPKLYTLEIRANGEKIVEKVGFREIKIDGCVFKINDEAVKLKGVNRHEFSPKGGATVTLAETVKDLRLMKELNVNAIRTSHYPDMPEFYLLCDYYGFYIMDECDLEMHGAATRQGGYDLKLWNEFAEDKRFEEGIFDRCAALVERDKNRSCVIMWSLGNESGFGKAFFKGAEYIRHRDSRPVHYEGLQNAPKKYYYTKHVDVVSYMYPSLEWIKKEVLDNEKETRPFVLCEYSHAMGNSCGDLAQYWELIYNNPQMMGAFVWEWADHSIKTKKGWCYGGDFGEDVHDGNFCADGLLTTDRKVKSAALEMKAVYGGKLKSEKKEVTIPASKPTEKELKTSFNADTGALNSIQVGEKELLASPVKLNILRYIDNERLNASEYAEFDMEHSKSYVIGGEKTGKGYAFEGAIVSNCNDPSVYYTLAYEEIKGGLKIKLKYKLADYVKRIPRIGLEFALPKGYESFSYIGFGPHESYIDKNCLCEYGYYTSTAEKNFTNYIRPQENGSHYATEYLKIDGAFSMTAAKPFSFSILPFTTEQLYHTKHSFALKRKGIVNVCIDLAMRGVGTHSCGPELAKEFEVPREGENEFTLIFE